MTKHAHLYKASRLTGYKFELTIINCTDIAEAYRDMDGVVLYFDSKAEARAAAKAYDAQPYNF